MDRRTRAKLKARLFSATTLKLQGNGISCDDLLTVAAVLGEAGIKRADQYLSEVKLMQLENGVSWSDMLDRQLTMVKRALRRDTHTHQRRSSIQKGYPGVHGRQEP